MLSSATICKEDNIRALKADKAVFVHMANSNYTLYLMDDKAEELLNVLEKALYDDKPRAELESTCFRLDAENEELKEQLEHYKEVAAIRRQA